MLESQLHKLAQNCDVLFFWDGIGNRSQIFDQNRTKMIGYPWFVLAIVEDQVELSIRLI